MALQPAIFLKPDAPLSNNLFPNGIPVSHSIPLLADRDNNSLWSVPVNLLTVIQFEAIVRALAKRSNASIDQIQGLAIEKQLFGLPNEWFLLLFGSDLTQSEAEALGRSVRITTELANSTIGYGFSMPTGASVMLCLILARALYAPGMPPPPPELTDFYARLKAKLPEGIQWETLTEDNFEESIAAAVDIPGIGLDLTPYLIYLIISSLEEFSLVSEEVGIDFLISHVTSPLKRALMDDFPQVATIILSERSGCSTI